MRTYSSQVELLCLKVKMPFSACTYRTPTSSVGTQKWPEASLQWRKRVWWLSKYLKEWCNEDRTCSFQCCSVAKSIDNKYKLKQKRFYLNIRKHFFTVLVMEHRHRLLKEFVEPLSFEIFRNHLDMVLGNLVYFLWFYDSLTSLPDRVFCPDKVPAADYDRPGSHDWCQHDFDRKYMYLSKCVYDRIEITVHLV